MKNLPEAEINILVFFQNEEIFVHLDELDELDRITDACIWIHLQFHRSTENILVQLLNCLTAKQVIWFQC